MAPLPTSLLAPILACISLYAAQKSYIAIINLQQYEEKSKKAAKHFDRAADELYKTRVTQASGVAAVSLSIISSVVLYARPGVSPLLPIFNATGTLLAYVHMTNFWKLKAQVPFVTGFNEGIRKSNDLRRILVTLTAGWVITAAVGILFQ